MKNKTYALFATIFLILILTNTQVNSLARSSTSVFPNNNKKISPGKPVLVIFSDPAHNIINIRGYNTIRNNLQTISRDLTGKKVAVKSFSASPGNFRLIYNMANLTNGIYFVTVTNGKTDTVLKLIKD